MQIFESFLVFLSSVVLQNQNQPTYTTLMKDQNFQLRKYDSWIVAQTVLQSTQEQAGNEAFQILGGYIFGKNEQKVKIEMTAPVTQFEVSPGKYAVQFFMPAQWTLQTLPKPLDNRITLKRIPERNLFVVQYHGGWSESTYYEELKELKVEAAKFKVQIKNDQSPIWAKYNSPMTPSPMRTNEIMFQVEA